jgi:hypothetical protein
MDILHDFLISKPWRNLSYKLKLERGGKCERCGYRPRHFSSLIGHHKVKLTESNVYDINISLNPDKIEIICHTCHNKEHDRFHNTHHVYIVYGSPLSGKTTMVMDMMQYGDIVLDMDALWRAVTFQNEYIKPKNVRFNVFKLRDDLLDQIKTRYGQWYDAYIIGGYPDKYERERLAEELGADVIYCESTKEDCIKRLQDSDKPNDWLEYIEDWWDQFNG